MKYSRQRELIRNTVLNNPIHPTADTVYSLVRELEPNISLGTVYRNLSLLAEQDVIRKIPIPDASDRFDGRLDAHHHMICLKCGQVVDLESENIPELDAQIRSITEFTVTSYQVLIKGFCRDCSVIH